MSALVALLGLGLLATAMWDQYWTALGEGGGPITRRVAGGVRGLFVRLHRVWPESRLLSVGGVATILATILVWVGMFWAGATLVFLADTESVVNATTGETADLWERIYFSGYTLSTLGIGDVQPRGALWRVFVPALSFLGLVQISFSIAYLIPISAAASHKRKVASYVSCLGESADDIVVNMWDGESVASLSDHLQSLTTDLVLLEQNHIAYPVLHYFHSLKRPEAIGPSLAVLDEALSLIEHGIEEGGGLEQGQFHPARRIISNFLQTLEAASIWTQAGDAADRAGVPPVPTLDRLRDNGVPVVSDAAFEASMDELADRRRLLHTLVEIDGWSWEVARDTDGADADEETSALAVHEAL